ncbi:MAG: hypothetical protein R2875_04980 [Desulfobacterales bacterium]
MHRQGHQYQAKLIAQFDLAVRGRILTGIYPDIQIAHQVVGVLEEWQRRAPVTIETRISLMVALKYCRSF